MWRVVWREEDPGQLAETVHRLNGTAVDREIDQSAEKKTGRERIQFKFSIQLKNKTSPGPNRSGEEFEGNEIDSRGKLGAAVEAMAGGTEK